jgi:lysophospholipase L1-like esterase
MIGTNDIAWWSVKTGAEVAADQAALIDKLQQLRPSAWIVVASIPPITSKAIPPNNVDRAQLARDYNAAAKTRIEARIAAGQKIRWADVYSTLSLSDLYDGVHPTQAAHAKVAHVWSQALRGIVTCSGASTTCGP